LCRKTFFLKKDWGGTSKIQEVIVAADILFKASRRRQSAPKELSRISGGVKPSHSKAPFGRIA
jgi:hypothetical protein